MQIAVRHVTGRRSNIWQSNEHSTATKVKVVITDFKRTRRTAQCLLYTSSVEVESVDSIRFIDTKQESGDDIKHLQPG